MADASEDNLLQTSVTTATEAPDLDDEVQDFRFLLSTAQNQKLPSRGIKDFEPHGTNLQQATLASSREAMHMALSQTRIHNRDPQRAVYDENDNGAWVFNPGGSWPSTVGRIKKFPVVQELEPTSRNECEEAADGYESDGSESVVVTTEPEHILPASRPAKKNKQAQPQRLWLLPEEALWLIERGSLEIRWPPDEGQAEDGGIPMSLQGAYSAFIGMEKQNGLTLEQYSVYQYLKRAGYTVLRAKDNIHNVPQHNDSASTIKQTGQLPIFSQLWRRLLVKEPPDVNTRGKIGPLVTPGLYRSYDDIYRMLLLIPFHDPKSHQSTHPNLEDPAALNVTYHVYKPGPNYKKTSPGPPDFYICVLNARETSIPTEPQLDALLKQTPYHAPNPTNTLYRKLKEGYSNVILAVVDQGVVSFINISDAGFGCERLWGREKKRSAGGAKRGGFGGKRGRGRGRGRGR